ncbi:MAG: formate dehydrogenase subunit delta [Pseudomonadota bacterium]|nr:formate dehydrogenase subunit delta [Pseudomonadota bacterium]
MTDTELKHLIKMINQISENLARGENTELDAARIVDHLKRFWAPLMREKIASYAPTDKDKLSIASRNAIALLQEKGD